MAPNDRPSKPLPKDKEKRRRELERLRIERQTRKRVEATRRARKRTAIIAAVVVVLAGAGVGAWAATGSSSKKSTPTAAASATPSAAATASATASAGPAAGSVHLAGCSTPAAGKPNGKQWKTEPALTVTSGTYTATLNTNCGPITLKLDATAAPHTVNSFAYLASQHYFDHVTCHRLTTTGIYVLQCGDPTGTGSGTPGYKFKDENLKAASIKGGTYPAGTVAMANSGANTNGSQFFLVYKDSQLPASYTPFGTITGGMPMLQKIGAAGAAAADATGNTAPLQTVVMNSVTVKKG